MVLRSSRASWVLVIFLGVLLLGACWAEGSAGISCVQLGSRGVPAPVPPSRVNDDYCDCIEDGVDEPEVSVYGRVWWRSNSSLAPAPSPALPHRSHCHSGRRILD